jgi:hypothetical protein
MSEKLKVNLDCGKSGVTFCYLKNDIFFRNLLLPAEFALALPGINAEVERIFFLL